MFNSLSDRLTSVVKKMRGQGRLSESNIKQAVAEVKSALLEADVALPVVKKLVARVRQKALGREVMKSVTPGQAFIGLVEKELTALMGEKNEALNLRVQPPAVVLMAGLQGSGKTTSTAKLARFLKEKEKKNVMVVSCDVYRPAAIEQLRVLAEEVGVTFFESTPDQKPQTIAKEALKKAKLAYADVLLVDTAGRLAIDDAMMEEIKGLHKVLKPIETLFVVDSMQGQDAANVASAFHKALPLTGTILTKVDGDARGGAALSVRFITEQPIKFLGTGEKSDALSPFHPERIASRILGMGDVVSLVEEAEQTIGKEKVQALNNKIKKGKGFDLNDFKDQIQQMNKMGGVGKLMEKLPGVSGVMEKAKEHMNAKEVSRMEAIINSMTLGEREQPDIIKGSRKRRIAQGAGAEVQDVNRLLKQFTQMQKMAKMMSKKGGMGRMMRGMQGML